MLCVLRVCCITTRHFAYRVGHVELEREHARRALRSGICAGDAEPPDPGSIYEPSALPEVNDDDVNVVPPTDIAEGGGTGGMRASEDSFGPQDDTLPFSRSEAVRRVFLWLLRRCLSHPRDDIRHMGARSPAYVTAFAFAVAAVPCQRSWMVRRWGLCE